MLGIVSKCDINFFETAMQLFQKCTEQNLVATCMLYMKFLKLAIKMKKFHLPSSLRLCLKRGLLDLNATSSTNFRYKSTEICDDFFFAEIKGKKTTISLSWFRQAVQVLVSDKLSRVRSKM